MLQFLKANSNDTFNSSHSGVFSERVRKLEFFEPNVLMYFSRFRMFHSNITVASRRSDSVRTETSEYYVSFGSFN